jgi:SpoVK/Ycf46/Vps4 family AAA+-type ATPase
MESRFINYIRAGCPLVLVRTHEELRVLTEYVHQLNTTNILDADGEVTEHYKAFSWDLIDGVRELTASKGGLEVGDPVEDNGAGEPLKPLEYIVDNCDEHTVLFLKDYHKFLDKEFDGSTAIIRKIRNIIGKLKAKNCTLVFVTPEMKPPVELEKETSIVDYRLPEKPELEITLESLCRSLETDEDHPNWSKKNSTLWPKAKLLDQLLDAALGMTTMEAETAFSMSLIEAQRFDPDIIRREKAQVIKKSEVLEVIEVSETLDDVGGLEILKQWVIARKNCFSAEAKAFGLKPPKGALFVGVPGCGKSLMAKAIAAAWQRTLLRLDFGKIFGKYVGESENNLDQCLKLAEAVSPCILWMDEVEKGLSGNNASGQEGHETTRRVFQMLLTWLQEKKKDVVLVATANSIDSLPPELISRFSVTFFVDLPDAVQREEIIRIHLRKYGRKPDMFGDKTVQLVELSDGFNGREIDTWTNEALTHAFSLGHKDLSIDDFTEAKKEISPISMSEKDRIAHTKELAKLRGAKSASVVRETQTQTASGGRKMNLGTAVPKSSEVPSDNPPT